MNGTVKWFSKEKGYGFIAGDDGRDYFVHHTGIAGKGFKTLAENEEVTFDTCADAKGDKAVNVKKN